MKRSRSTHRRAFTLLELMLSSGIVALLMLSLYTALHAAYKARGVMNAQAARVRSARIALDLVEQNLRSILPPNAQSYGTLAGPFYGTASEIDCYTLGRDYGRDTDPLADGMRSVQMTLDATGSTSGSTSALVQKVQRNVLSDATANPASEIIATDVTAFTISYYDGTTWTDSWDSTALDNALPFAVQVAVTVQLLPTESPYTMSRIIPLPCGVNGGTASTAASGTTIGSP